MSNVNTNQRFVQNDMAVLAPLTTSFQKVQFPAKSQYGTGNVLLPLPDSLKADSKKINVSVYFDFVLATVSAQTLEVRIYAQNSAGTLTEIATTGAVALATQAGANDSGFLTATMLLDKNVAGTSGTIRGSYSGQVSTSLVTAASLVNPPLFTYTNGTSTTNENAQSDGWDGSPIIGSTATSTQGFILEAELHGADATSVLTILEFFVDIV
jgi:hypothetical protein